MFSPVHAVVDGHEFSTKENSFLRRAVGNFPEDMEGVYGIPDAEIATKLREQGFVEGGTAKIKADQYKNDGMLPTPDDLPDAKFWAEHGAKQ